jgi:hypothetical protein
LPVAIFSSSGISAEVCAERLLHSCLISRPCGAFCADGLAANADVGQAKENHCPVCVIAALPCTSIPCFRLWWTPSPFPFSRDFFWHRRDYIAAHCLRLIDWGSNFGLTKQNSEGSKGPRLGIDPEIRGNRQFFMVPFLMS